jgi:hypothetical protein
LNPAALIDRLNGLMPARQKLRATRNRMLAHLERLGESGTREFSENEAISTDEADQLLKGLAEVVDDVVRGCKYERVKWTLYAMDEEWDDVSSALAAFASRGRA